MMEIQGIHEIYQSNSARSTARQVKKPGENPSAAADGTMDTVEISREASFRARLSAESKQYTAAARAAATVPSERLEALKLQYQGDRCPVSGMDVARAILGRVCGL